MRAARVTLSGYYGFGNAGDEAVLAGLIQSLRGQRSAEELEITALSIHPSETVATHGFEIKAAHRYKAAALIRALARTDVLLSGGGSLLQDVTSAHSIFYYLGVVRLAQLLGKKTMFVAQGIGPLRRPRSRRLVAAVANRLTAITVRDTASAALLREIGVHKPLLEVTADPALLLRPTRAIPRPPKPWFAVALRPWAGDTTLVATVAEACRYALDGVRALVIPMQPSTDTAIGEQFAAKWHQTGKANVSPAQSGLASLINNLASCDLVIGMRLHALILATACCVPSVALAYDPKVEAFMAQAGQSQFVYDVSQPDLETLTALLAQAWAGRDERTTLLQEQLSTLRAAAERNAEIALRLLE